MKDCNLNQLIQDVHQNAIDHGWWASERTAGSVRALIHSELSEALESDRREEPLLWHKCPHCGSTCESMNVHEETLPCEACTPQMRKPEGAAVELIDFCIRILDWMGRMELTFPDHINTPEQLTNDTVGDYQDDCVDDVRNVPLPDLVDLLHVHICVSRLTNETRYLLEAIGIVFAWLEARGLDPVEILMEKHRFNVSRPYLHGKKY